MIKNISLLLITLLLLGCGATATAYKSKHSIMGQGRTTSQQLQKFLKRKHAKASASYIKKLANIYISEAKKEGVNHDIAFCQMCLETGFLKFSRRMPRHHNNFAGIGAVDRGHSSAKFKSIRIGVRAQIQHLKAYASKKPLRLTRVDPRFNLVKRGSATTIHALAGKWASDRAYGTKLQKLLKSLHSS